MKRWIVLAIVVSTVIISYTIFSRVGTPRIDNGITCRFLCLLFFLDWYLTYYGLSQNLVQECNPIVESIYKVLKGLKSILVPILLSLLAYLLWDKVPEVAKYTLLLLFTLGVSSNLIQSSRKSRQSYENTA